MPTSPLVFRYDDYRGYVRDWLSQRPRLSQRWFALRVETSASRVSMILSGKRPLNLADTPQWTDVLGLSDTSEAEHFQAMVEALHGPSTSVRDRARVKVQAGVDYARTAGADQIAQWLGSWLHLTLLEAARHPLFDGDPVALAERLWPRVSVERVEGALADLIDAGALTPGPAGWRTDERPLHTAMRIRTAQVSEAAVALHEDQLQHALQALGEVPGDRRFVGSVTMAIRADGLEDVLAACRSVPLEVATAHADESGEEVVEVVVAAFPRTRRRGK